MKFFSWMGIVPCIFVGGVSAIYTPLFLIVPREDSGGNPYIPAALSGGIMVLFSTGAGVCLQIVRQRYWPSVEERLKNRRGAASSALLGGVLIPFTVLLGGVLILMGFPGEAVIGLGALLVIGGAMLLGNGLAALLTGMPWKKTANVFTKHTLQPAASELLQKINPVEISIGGIDCTPELLEVSPEYDEQGKLSVIRSALTSEPDHAPQVSMKDENGVKEFLKRLEHNS